MALQKRLIGCAISLSLMAISYINYGIANFISD